ncbi:MAG: 3-deoxy-D-manno-octulosonic acid transferase [Candidatus Omnitrophica bacterium]|nr:3-deoxy-D-manno-octulosonic acid transferase [Candidatus Omnitrophota bacterium]
MKIILILYDFILILLIPFYFVSLIFKNKFSWQVFRRFKTIDKEILEEIVDKDVIWIHAVSLGEVSTCKSLIKQLSLRYPQKIILITTITSTGRILTQSISKDNILSLYMPFDLSFLISYFVNKIKPKLLILIETELWPNLLYSTQRLNIPVLVLNARLSDRSFGKYRLFSWFMRRLVRRVKMFCVQSDLDKHRFLQLGIDSERVQVTGNMKFDAIEELDSKQLSDLATLKSKISLSQKDFLIVAGSTHDKEEEYIIDSFIELKKEFTQSESSPLTGFNNLRLLIAPRHLERLDFIESLIESKNIKSERFSRIKFSSSESVLLLDTIGQLRLIYSLANFVFVGGSLVPVGGHNILEPAFFEKPILVGPYMHNFRAISQLFLSNQALIQVKNFNELKSKMKELISNNDRLMNLGKAAKSVLASMQGATLTNLNIIEKNIL